jgi:hypothetical protein
MGADLLQTKQCASGDEHNDEMQSWKKRSMFIPVFLPVNVSDGVVVMNSHDYQQQAAAKGLQANSHTARRRRTEFRVLAQGAHRLAAGPQNDR